MKRIFTGTCSLLVFTALLFTGSCKKAADTKNTKLRDVTVKAQVRGDYTQDIDFTLQQGTSNAQGIGVSAVYLASMNTIQLNIIGGASWALILSGNATGITEGPHTMEPGYSTYYNTAEGANQYTSVTGTLTIDTAESTSPLSKASDRYVSGTFNATFSVAGKTITVTGSFVNIYVSGS